MASLVVPGSAATVLATPRVSITPATGSSVVISLSYHAPKASTIERDGGCAPHLHTGLDATTLSSAPMSREVDSSSDDAYVPELDQASELRILRTMTEQMSRELAERDVALDTLAESHAEELAHALEQQSDTDSVGSGSPKATLELAPPLPDRSLAGVGLARKHLAVRMAMAAIMFAAVAFS